MCGILLALCAARLVNQRPAGGDSVQITQKMRLPGGDIDICIVCSALIHKEWLIIQMARRRIIKPRQRWTNQPTHSPQFQLSVPPGGGVCTSDINDMTPCLVADYIISLHTSHCLQHCRHGWCTSADQSGPGAGYPGTPGIWPPRFKYLSHVEYEHVSKNCKNYL